MNNFLLFIAGLLVLALSALFAAPYFVDWNDYRDVFEEQASLLIGRTVNVGGDVSLTLLPAPVLRFETVNVADENGGFDTPIISARSFTVWLAMPPLLRGAIEAREVQLEQPVLNLKIGENGSGNWRDIGRTDVSLPFVPRSVALDSVKISDATVALARGSADPYLVLDHFDGELSVRSLKGPYKFTGTFQAGGETKQLRFSTGHREKEAPLKLKAIVQDEAGRESYLFDGNLAGLDGVPQFRGAFHARFAGSGAAGVKEPPANAEDDAAPVQIKAQVEAGLEKARFGDLEITVRHSNKPQTIRGQLEASYGDGLVVESELASRWVDLDALTGELPANPRSATDTVAAIALRTVNYASFLKKGRLTVAFEQAVLAGDLLNGLKGEVTSDGSAVTLRQLSAALPGENRITLKGDLATKEKTPSFAGSLEVEGNKLNRLLNWVGFGAQSIVAAQEGDFSLKGKLTAGQGSLALEGVVGQLFGSQFSGVFRYASGKRRKIELTLKSERLDLSTVFGPGVKPLSLPALLRSQEDGGAKSDTAGPLAWLGKAEARIDLDVGAMTLPGLGTSVMSAGLHIVDDDIDIRKLQLQSDRGFDIQANGALTGLAGKPEGNITVAAHADTVEGIVALGSLLELNETLTGDDSRLAGMVPVQVTASVRSMNKGAAGLTARIEGNVGASDLTGIFSLKGSMANWSRETVNVDVALRNGSGREMLTQLLPHLSKNDLSRFDESPGSFELKAAGIPAEGMSSSIDMKVAGIGWNAKGTAISTGSDFDFTGKSELRGPNAASLLSLVGVALAPGRETESVKLESKIKTTPEAIEFKEFKGSVGQETFGGSGRLVTTSAKPRIKLDIVASAISLPALMEPLVAWDSSTANDSGIVRGLTRTSGFWPDEPIDTKVLSAVDGELTLEAERLHLAGAMVLGAGKVKAELENGILEIKDIEGTLYGGTFKAEARLSTPGSGLTFEGRGEARQMRLERIAHRSGDGALARGPVDLSLSLEGSGLSPRGIAAGLNGDGAIAFGEGEVHRLAPGAPAAVVADIGKAGQEGAMDDDKLAAAVSRNLKVSGFAFAPVKVPIEVRNGVARLEKASLGNPVGQATVTTFVELATLKLDSEWVLEAASGQGEERPRFSLAFAGSIGDLGAIRPVIDTQALKRYATIRRMERDVETLEKLEVPGTDTEPVTAKIPAPQAQSETASFPKKTEPAPRTNGAVSLPDQPKTAAIPVKPPPPPPPLPTRTPQPPPSPPASASTPPPSTTTAPSAPVVSRPEPPPLPAAPPASPAPALPWLVPETPPQTATVPPVEPPAAVAPDPAAPIRISPVPNTAATPNIAVEPDTAAQTPAPVTRERDDFRNLDLLQQDGG